MPASDVLFQRLFLVAAALAIALLAGCAVPGGHDGRIHLGVPGTSHPATPADAPVQERTPRATAVAMHAMGLVGTPYTYGGNTPETGFDCSGLIHYVFGLQAVSVPRTVRMLHSFGSSIERARLNAGDLVLFPKKGHLPDHAGIYVGEGRFVHAPSTGGTVRIDSLSNPYWVRRGPTFRRI